VLATRGGNEPGGGRNIRWRKNDEGVGSGVMRRKCLSKGDINYGPGELRGQGQAQVHCEAQTNAVRRKGSEKTKSIAGSWEPESS